MTEGVSQPILPSNSVIIFEDFILRVWRDLKIIIPRFALQLPLGICQLPRLHPPTQGPGRLPRFSELTTPLSIASYDAALEACDRGSQVTQALELFEQLHKDALAARQSSGVVFVVWLWVINHQ